MCKKIFHKSKSEPKGVSLIRNIGSKYKIIFCGEDTDPETPVEDDF